MSGQPRFVLIYLLGFLCTCHNICPTLSQQPTQNNNIVGATYEYMGNNDPGDGRASAENGAVADGVLNPTSHQPYIIEYNREIPQQQQFAASHRQPTQAYGVNQPQANRQNQPQLVAPQYTQFLAPNQAGEGPQQHQQQQQHQQLQQQLSQKLFNLPSYPQQQQPTYLQQIDSNNYNNRRHQLIANGNSLPTVPSSATILPSSSSLPSSLAPSGSHPNSFKPLLPIDIDDVVNGDDEKSPTSPPGQCQMCCTPTELLPCSSSGCCDFSGFLNIKTLKSTVG